MQARPIEVVTEEADLEFEDFFRAEYSRLCSAAYMLTGDRGEAEDVAQEALSRAYERWEKVREMSSPSGYAYRTALNVHRKRIRRRRRKIMASESQVAPDQTGSVEDRLVIRQLLQALSRAQREALVLVEGLGLDPTEAAALLGISVASVRARVHRAREELKRRSGDRHG